MAKIDPTKQTHDVAKASKGTAGKDSRRLKANKNITQELPDRSKEVKLEAEATRMLAEAHESQFDVEHLAVIDLVAQGLSYRQIGALNGATRKRTAFGSKLPTGWSVSWRTIVRWRKKDPAFAEATEEAHNEYVRASVMEVAALSESLDQITGLKGRDLVYARDKRIQRTLQIAGRRLRDWADIGDVDAEIVVYEVGDGWQPERVAAGSPGQGPESDEAAVEWRQIRDVTQ